MILSYTDKYVEAGCDEAGRGCLAGPVFAAAVILPQGFFHPLLNDSKLLSEKNRLILRDYIEQNAVDFAVGKIGEKEIDRINILNASIRAMHVAIRKLKITPEYLLIDGNQFKSYNKIPHQCIVKGDSKYAAIAAASILAKTYRDEYMVSLSQRFPQYQWSQNKGYGTLAHRVALQTQGSSKHHRKTFQVKNSIDLKKI